MIGLLDNRSFALDLGNNNTILSNSEQVLLSEPTCIVFDANTHKVKAVGGPAYDIVGKNHEELMPVQPLKWGVIADYESTRAMIKSMVSKTFPKRSLFPKYNEIISGIPYAATNVERRALTDVLDQFNSRRRFLLHEPIAAAIGMKLNIREPQGKMIVDIGGGITEIVIISLSGIASFKSIKTGGDTLTAAIQDHLRKQYNLQIGWRMAEQTKIAVGGVMPSQEDIQMLVRGKDLMEGIPAEKSIGMNEIVDVFQEPMRSIERAIVDVLETCPPELAADIYETGIHVTGGGALLHGMRERLARATHLPIHIDREPLLAVSKGISTVLKNTKAHQSILMN